MQHCRILDTLQHAPYGPPAFEIASKFQRRGRFFSRVQRGIEAMAEQDPEARLRQLEERLQEARKSSEAPVEAQSQQSKMGIAFRFVADLLAGVIVGTGIGWGLDRVFGTSPLLLIVMLFVGIAAGVVNVVRTAKEMNNKAQ
jgi:ATP synthase protein I